jgi:hypothetical protein
MYGALAGSIKKIVRVKAHPVVRTFLQAANCRYTNNPPNIEGTERIDVRAMIQFMR